jgi:cytochrome c-type biogenesis protein CcmE
MKPTTGIKYGTIVSIFVATLAVTGMVIAFLSNASPYVSVKEALKSSADDLHVAGNLDPASLITDVRAREVRFTITDDQGDALPIVYSGEPISNMGDATKIVAIGKCQDGKLLAHKLLVKCPSKYESAKKPTA